MREVAVMRSAVKAVLEELRRSGATRVTGVRLLLSASDDLSEEAARQLFAILAANTPAEAATLSISRLPATYTCLKCEQQFTSSRPGNAVTCPVCRGGVLALAHKDRCYVSGIDVVFGGAPQPLHGQRPHAAPKVDALSV